MKFIKRYTGVVVKSLFAAAIVSTSITDNAIADDEAQVYAFPDKWMVRVGGYFVDRADTTFSINSAVGGLGTTIDFSKDLDGEDSDTIPRIDAYYRFNQRHRIDFTTFSIDRKGIRTLNIDPPIVIDGEDFSGGTISSEIKYTLYKLGYVYSFYHSPKVELGISAGLNVTKYNLKFEADSGGVAEAADTTLPLPVFGLRMGYAITPKWYVHYVTESFFIDIDDTFKGALLNYELNTEYKLFKHFAIGAGFARLGMHGEIDDDNWRGAVTDTYSGYTLFGTFYF